jgi:hypothetical protein
MDLKIIYGSGGEQKYVVRGAKLRCSCGDQKSQLQIPKEHGIDINDKPQANIMDYQPMVNIQPFGKCKSMVNPTVKAATKANHGKLKPMPCVPNITMPWINGKQNVQIDSYPALTNQSTNMCMWCGQITITDDGQK